MTALALLEDAKALIATPEKWCQGVLCRDADGHVLRWALAGTPDYHAVASFCALGALYRACSLGKALPPAAAASRIASLKEAIQCLSHAAITEFSAYTSLSDFNDHHNHSDVLRLFDRAISELKEGEVNGQAQ